MNVGRGTVIDQDALTTGLRSGRVGFAALDVYEREPLGPDDELWQLPNDLISPHTAALTDQDKRSIAQLFADNATRLLDSRPLRNRVNTDDFY